MTLAVDSQRKKAARELILDAFDSEVLGNEQTEPYFALYFGFLLGLGKAATIRRSGDEWSSQFNQAVYNGVPQRNPFNSTKLDGLNRWFHYVGLGWYDPQGIFQCNPYDRVRRALPRIFEGKKKLDSNAFMQSIAAVCPDLDGGEIFRKASPHYDPSTLRCSLGLSHALIELHDDQQIRLICPRDSVGWSLEEAEPTPDGKTIAGSKVDFIECLI